MFHFTLARAHRASISLPNLAASLLPVERDLRQLLEEIDDRSPWDAMAELSMIASRISASQVLTLMEKFQGKRGWRRSIYMRLSNLNSFMQFFSAGYVVDRREQLGPWDQLHMIEMLERFAHDEVRDLAENLLRHAQGFRSYL